MTTGGRQRAALARREMAVRRAEAYVRAHLDTLIPVSRLCRVVGLSERGLRNAFYEVRGMSPKRWILAERLSRTQMALCKPPDLALTVTAVAADHGFSQLGRFAGMYRKRFGETPSETLEAAWRDRGLLHQRRSQGDGYAGTVR